MMPCGGWRCEPSRSAAKKGGIAVAIGTRSQNSSGPRLRLREPAGSGSARVHPRRRVARGSRTVRAFVEGGVDAGAGRRPGAPRRDPVDCAARPLDGARRSMCAARSRSRSTDPTRLSTKRSFVPWAEVQLRVGRFIDARTRYRGAIPDTRSRRSAAMNPGPHCPDLPATRGANATRK